MCIDMHTDQALISATSERPFVPPIAEWRRVSSGLADLQRRARTSNARAEYPLGRGTPGTACPIVIRAISAGQRAFSGQRACVCSG